MKTVVHIIVGLGDGGAERSLFKLVTSDTTNSHQIISLTGRGKYGPLFDEARVQVISIGWKSFPTMNGFARLVRYLLQVRPDVLVGWMPHSALLSTVLHRFVGSRKLLWMVRASDYGTGRDSAATRHIVRVLSLLSKHHPDSILVVGQRALEAHVELGFCSEKMHLLPNGYSIAPGAEPTKERHLRLGERVQDKPTVFGMAARFHPQKDHQGLLRAFAQVASKNSNWVLRLLGEGMDERNSELVGVLTRLNLINNVVLCGQVSDPAQFFLELDFHILSSSYGEGFPNVVAESMLHGVPNIVTDVGDSSAIVADTGFVVSPHNPNHLAEAISDAMRLTQSERAQMGFLARKRIIEYYPLAATVELFQNELDSRTVIAFPRYSRLGASSRVRMYQYEEYLTSKGWRIHYFPFFSDSLLLARYQNRWELQSIIRAYLERITALRMIRSADLVWVEKELIPWVPRLVEEWLTPRHHAVVYDFDDAVHEHYRAHSNWVVRRLLSSKAISSTVGVSGVLVGNANLADYFGKNPNAKILLAPSVVDTNVILPPARKERLNVGHKFIIGWIGTPVTFRAYLRDRLDMFEFIAQELDAEFWIIGAQPTRLENDRIQFFPWDRETENLLLSQIDVGVMPLEDDPWSRGKCAYKIVQYMAAGKPVVVTPVGANVDVVEDGKTGFFAKEAFEWEIHLRYLSRNPRVASEMGRLGAEKVSQYYSLQKVAPEIEKFFEQAER